MDNSIVVSVLFSHAGVLTSKVLNAGLGCTFLKMYGRSLLPLLPYCVLLCLSKDVTPLSFVRLCHDVEEATSTIKSLLVGDEPEMTSNLWAKLG